MAAYIAIIHVLWDVVATAPRIAGTHALDIADQHVVGFVIAVPGQV